MKLNIAYLTKSVRSELPSSRKILFIVLLALGTSWCCKVFLFGLYLVPSASMEPTLSPNDRILVSKARYGAIVDFGSLFGKRSTYKRLRLPGYAKVASGDIVVFHSPRNYQTVLVKRCVGLPRDTIFIKESKLFVNHHLLKSPSVLSYEVISKDSSATNKNMKLLKIVPTSIKSDKNRYIYSIGLSDKAFSDFLLLKSSDSCSRVKLPQLRNGNIFPVNMQNIWDEFNYGPLVIPWKGMRITLDQNSILTYFQQLKYEMRYIEVIDNKLFFKGKSMSSYVFKSNYYYMMGDNRDHSFDSRWFGLIPEDLVIGKSLYVFH